MKKKFPKTAVETILTAIKIGAMSTSSGVKAVHELFSLCVDGEDITLDNNDVEYADD